MSGSITVEVVHAKSLKQLVQVELDRTGSTVSDVKKAVALQKPNLYVTRQSIRTEQNGKNVKDDVQLETLNVNDNTLKLFLKDLGPQIGWTTVFLTEYAGPLFIYLIFYFRPSLIYGTYKPAKMSQAANIACACWVGHYAKRLLETVFVHRFSNATMPIMNIFKNSTYYWGFAAFVSYYINHPLYTPPVYGDRQLYFGLALFILNELGNLSIHLALRNLRPAGSKVRKIPYPSANPFTLLFNFVSCPNYTYEIGAWIAFSILAQSLPALLFTFAGGYQMMVWAQGKHRNYRREFEKYPRGRKAIFPFLI